MLRPVFYADRNHGGANHHGRVSSIAPAALAAACRDPLSCHHPCCPYRIACRRRRHLPVDHSEPGHFKHAASFCSHSACDLHKRSQPDGRICEPLWLKTTAWACAAFILTLDIWLLIDQIRDWIASGGRYRIWIETACSIAGLGFAILLAIVILWPVWSRVPIVAGRVAVKVSDQAPHALSLRTYSRILVPLDHSPADQIALSNAVTIAKMHQAQVVLLHVEEDITSRMFGALSSTAEIAEGQTYLSSIASSLEDQGITVSTAIRHGHSPAKEIVAAVEELHPDLVVMASHGHRGLKDLIFGTTINAVRHRIKVPLLIVSSS